jgi:hypothetical protein
VLAFFIVRQRRSDRFRERSLLFSSTLGLYGAVLLTHVLEARCAATTSIVLLLLSALASIPFGVIRGSTELFVRGDALWERASWRTIGVGWGRLVVSRIALIALATALGAKAAASPASIPLMLAITLAVQMLVVTGRARELGVPTQTSSPRLRRNARRRGSGRFS